ncbi:hypothetical protein C4577_03710 [Candidatus Parcubacteria bacterium]|nr:MAG: hypothetical protein C4577_03710 [Candidatus Parcubacteria bacterium]
MAGEIKHCEKCNCEHDGSYGSGRFCSKHCAYGRNVNGNKNPMYGQTVYEIWVNKYGKEVANIKWRNCVISQKGKGTGPRPNQSVKVSGCLNPMWGRTHSDGAKAAISHKNTGRKHSIKSNIQKSISGKRAYAEGRFKFSGEKRSIRGYWKGLYYGSTSELMRMMNHPNLSLLKRGPSISYEWFDGSHHTYLSDFLNVLSNTIEEIKYPGKQLSELEQLKVEAGKKYAKENGLNYNVLYEHSIPKEEMFILRKHYMVTLDSKHETEYQIWLERRNKRGW